MKVLVICGSKSDIEIANLASETLTQNKVSNEVVIASAHREPEKVREIVKNSDADIFIAIAGLSAALPGFIASLTKKPVIGVPVKAASAVAGGLDALLAIAQLPPGVPVATVGIDNAKNAAYLAMRIIDSADGSFRVMRRGKVKDVFEIGNKKLLFDFTNRVSAFDIILNDEIPFKGEVLCRLSEYFFQNLGIPNHLIDTIKPNKMIVRKVDLIPIECVVRGYLYGSLFERVQNGEVKLSIDPILAAELPNPLFDPTTKFEAKDRPITKEEIINNKWLNEEEYEWLKEKSIETYLKIKKMADRSGFILADIKFEFGKDENGNILLADSIGPDEFRMWPKENYSGGKTQEAYDKQVVRDWLTKVGWKKSLDEARKAGKPLPEPPKLPQELIEETTKRYIHVFEKLTGERFR